MRGSPVLVVPRPKIENDLLFGVIPLDWRAWAVMLPVTAGSSFFGVYMTRWILKLVPLWGEPTPSEAH